MSATEATSGIAPIGAKGLGASASALIAAAPTAPEPQVDRKWSGRKTLAFVVVVSAAAWATIIGVFFAVF